MRKYENKENKTTINGKRNSIQALQYSVSSLLPLLFFVMCSQFIGCLCQCCRLVRTFQNGSEECLFCKLETASVPQRTRRVRDARY